jgi:hypothetical protein
MQVIYKLSKNETLVANEMVRLLKQMGWEMGQEEKPQVELLSTCPGAPEASQRRLVRDGSRAGG